MTKEKLPAVGGFAGGLDIYVDASKFELAKKIGEMFAGSDLVPDRFKGKPENCIIALSLASKLNADPFMLMKNIYFVHGQPGFMGKFYAALVNQCGRFTPLEYKFGGEGDNFGCRAMAHNKQSGEEIKGPKVTRGMVKSEGWSKNPKWQSMEELMFHYRAAAMFARVHAPEVTMGMMTVEELEDVQITKVKVKVEDKKEEHPFIGTLKKPAEKEETPKEKKARRKKLLDEPLPEEEEKDEEEDKKEQIGDFFSEPVEEI